MEDEVTISRGATGLRILYTVLFFVIAQVLETVFSVIVLFELVYTLILEREPSPIVRRFANRVLSYFYRIGRYLSYNDSEIPFPFRDFPEEVEAIPPGTAE
ncbi:MAG: DUF4389 domain-containing protein [Myxococcota bacterium]|nr:DUF4389 domain-containing protein [Myxococcota bacterium]